MAYADLSTEQRAEIAAHLAQPRHEQLIRWQQNLLTASEQRLMYWLDHDDRRTARQELRCIQAHERALDGLRAAITQGHS